MSSGDVEARGVKERKVVFPFVSVGRQELNRRFSLFFFFFSFISFSFIHTLLSLFDTSMPVEASTGSRNDNVNYHLKRARKQKKLMSKLQRRYSQVTMHDWLKIHYTVTSPSVRTHQAHKHNNNGQLEVLHTHGSCQVTTCGLKCD